MEQNNELIYSEEYVTEHCKLAKQEGMRLGLEESVRLVEKMVLSSYLSKKDEQANVLRELAGLLEVMAKGYRNNP